MAQVRREFCDIVYEPSAQIAETMDRANVAFSFKNGYEFGSSRLNIMTVDSCRDTLERGEFI
jgi:hypothetical protein